MLSNYSVGVWNREPSTKVNGVTIPGVLAWVRNIDVDMQPYSQELFIRQYGYNIEVTKRFFIEDIRDIKIGTVLQYGAEKHEVKKVIAWDDYYDVMTLEVI
jgi:hypothetical protein